MAGLLRSAVAGALLVNAIPHGVAAVSGRDFPSPFGEPPGVGLTPPLENAIWASANLVAGAALLPRAPLSLPKRCAVVVGAVGMTFVLAKWFGRVMADMESDSAK